MFYPFNKRRGAWHPTWLEEFVLGSKNNASFISECNTVNMKDSSCALSLSFII